VLELDGYRVDSVLGEGGSGTVYGATRETTSDDIAAGTRVAIKALRADLALTDGEVKRFLDEAALMHRLSHPNIVGVLASGQLPDGRPYLVMPRLDGETLAQRLRTKPLTVGDALALFDQLAEAVSTLHVAGIIHRDLKPENVFVVDDARAVLLDFGIAKERDAGPSTTTIEGRVRGTPAYMAPERFFTTPASVRSDVYELAVTFFEMLVGGLPWKDVEDIPARLDPDGRDVPPALWAVLRPALNSNAQARPASVQELRDAIKRADDLPLAVRTATIVRRRLPASASTDPSPFAQTDAQPPAATGARDALRSGSTTDAGQAVVQVAPISPRSNVPIVIGTGLFAAAGVVVYLLTRHGAATTTAPPPAASTPPVPFCTTVSPKPDFCADFEGPEYRAGFYNADKTPDPGENGGGTIRLRPAQNGESAVAEMTSPPLAAATNKASAMLIAELAPIRYATITLKLRVDAEKFLDEKAVAMLFQLDFGKAGAITISRKQAGMQLSVYDGPSSAKAPFAMPIPVGKWQSLKILVRNYAVTDDGRGEIEVMADGVAATLPLPASIQGYDKPRLDLGVVAAKGPQDTFRVQYDDVFITTFEGPEPPTAHDAGAD
jgi:serine/threonine-protein kinase